MDCLIADTDSDHFLHIHCSYILQEQSPTYELSWKRVVLAILVSVTLGSTIGVLQANVILQGNRSGISSPWHMAQYMLEYVT